MKELKPIKCYVPVDLEQEFPDIDEFVTWVHPDGKTTYWEFDKDMDWDYVKKMFPYNAPSHYLKEQSLYCLNENELELFSIGLIDKMIKVSNAAKEKGETFSAKEVYDEYLKSIQP